MLKEIKSENSCSNEIPSKSQSRSICDFSNDRSYKNPFIRCSKNRKGRHFRSEKTHHNPLLSPAPLKEWIENSPGESTTQWRKEFHTYLEVSLEIKSYQMNPIRISFFDNNGKKCEYQPLFLLNYWTDTSAPKKRKNLIGDIWCNADIRSNADWFIPAWKAAHRFCQYKNLTFRIFRDSFFLSNYFSNIQFINKYRWNEVNESDWKFIDQILEEKNLIKISEILTFLGNDKENRLNLTNSIWTLIATGCIETDWNKPFNLDTTIWSNSV